MNDLLSVISKKYAIPIIALLYRNGTMRSKEIERTVGSKSTSTFAKRLKELVEADLLDRKQYDEIPPRVEYSLTTRGEELAERLQPLLRWAHEN
jgi:DNA-binding HxlR family transcriptional regulator